MKVSLFDYDLPADRIAQAPRERGSSRLLLLDRQTGEISHRRFSDLPSLLRPGDVLVRNDVRVRNARLWGRDTEGRLTEIFLVESISEERLRWQALARPGRRAKPGRRLDFAEGIIGTIVSVSPDGRREVLFDRPIDDEFLERAGTVPLPPYIRRAAGAPDRDEDRAAYQTVFARQPLAVAAPTAGLHFTAEVLAEIAARGVQIADLTLAVGPGTFKPVTAEDTASHVMGAERVWIPGSTRRAVAAAASSGRVAAVGTTVARSLEAAARIEGAPDGDLEFSTDLFITPGFQFRTVDALLTNFHLPTSTLLMLVCAFAGREPVLKAYREAVREEYFFYSFGDAMLIS
ncbi:MAG: tRNA preQ1(34) S-adenosylmethionine ribosyltransferase-isomerase QueA [Acidobacteriota bacterium]